MPKILKNIQTVGKKRPGLILRNERTLIERILIAEFNGKYRKDENDDWYKAGTIEKFMSDYVDETRNPPTWYIKRVLLYRELKTCETIAEVKARLNKAIKQVTGNYLKIIERLRAEILKCKTLKDAKGLCKRRLTKHVYLSCAFNGAGCTLADVTHATTLIVYDLQGIPDEQVKALKRDPRTAMLHKSVGAGKGDYALILWAPGITVSNYTEFWGMGCRFLEKEFEITSDKIDKTNDITRVRYRSFDPTCFFNEDAQPIFVNDIVIDLNFTAEQRNKIDAHLNIEGNWYKLLFSLAVAKGEEGRELAHTICKENPGKYSREAVDVKYSQCLNKINNGSHGN